MTRQKKLLFNSASSLLYQFVALICGFILPRIILTTYGSSVNGLVSSVTQFLGFISLCEMGVGAVVQSSLYKPLADNNLDQISKICKSSDRFFKRIAFILVGYTLILMIVYPFSAIEEFDYLYTFLLIFVISISTFAQYYFGMTWRLLLSADQLGFIHYIVHSASLIVNTVVCVILMKAGMSIHIVKLATSLIFMSQPLTVCIYAKHKYTIDKNVVLTEEPIKQKWNGLAQHIATVVLSNTGTVVLTLLSTLENVSVYAVYQLVLNGIKQIITSLTNGMQAMLGNMLANNETEELNRTFHSIEWLLHTVVTYIFGVAAVLLVPFVSVYTADITDANYIVPAFSYLFTFANAVYCIRLPYNIMVLAAGHYKQTQWSAIIEAVINIAVSVILVLKIGLIGVAIGTLIAMAYRTVYLAHYLTKNILYRKIHHFIKHLLIDAVCVIILFLITHLLPSFFTLGEINYFSWIALAVKVAVVALFILIIINCIFYRNDLKTVFAKATKKMTH